jgi:hypothetical protein
VRGAFLLPLFLFTLITLTGCSHYTDAQLLFHPTKPIAKNTRNVSESFPGAYISSTKDGEYDLVLVKDTLRATRAKEKKGPLQPVTQPPLQQAVCFHIFWKPTHGAMIRESSVTNAIVDWYVFGPEYQAKPDMLHYTGAAFVKLDSKGNITWVTIGDGDIAPAQSRGNLKDPVGPARISGDIIAMHNDGRVRELLQSIKDRIAGNDHIWTEAQNDLAPADR